MNTSELSEEFKLELQGIFNQALIKYGKEQALVIIRNKDTMNGYTVPKLMASLMVRGTKGGQLKTEDIDVIYNVIKYDAEMYGQVRIVPILSSLERALKIAETMMIDGDYKVKESDNESIVHYWISPLSRVMIQKTVIE